MVFAEGQTEAMAPVETTRNKDTTGDREFSIELTALTDGLIVGFNDKATVTIIDTESSSTEDLHALVDEGKAAEPEWYTAGWDAYISAVNTGSAALEKRRRDSRRDRSSDQRDQKGKRGAYGKRKIYERKSVLIPVEAGQFCYA